MAFGDPAGSGPNGGECHAAPVAVSDARMDAMRASEVQISNPVCDLME
ncbi:hypothetical protein [Mesorhizobium sp. CN2-181]